MTTILERVAQNAHGVFRPKCTQDFFALQLARKLNDAPTAGHYRDVVAEHRKEDLLALYRQVSASNQPQELAKRFNAELPKIGAGNGLCLNRHRLLAFFIQRRSIAAVIFIGDHVDYTQIRQLPSNRAKVIASAVSFARWLVESFKVQSAAMEIVSAGDDIQRGQLAKAATDFFRSEGIAIWQISKSELFASFGSPALRSRREVREVVSTIWPVLKTGRANDILRDALGLGLHVQIESLFNQ